MKNKVLKILSLGLIMALLTGCGSEAELTDGSVEESTEESTTDEAEPSKESAAPTATPEPTEEPEDDIYVSPEEAEEKLNLVEYEDSYEDREYSPVWMQKIWSDQFEQYIEEVTLEGSIYLYLDEDICIGYTKPGITVQIIKKQGDWCQLLDVSGQYALVKYSDIEKARADAGDEASNKELANAAPSEETQTAASAEPAPSVEARQPESETPEEAPVVVSEKYTPEEAIAVYRSILEESGVTWNPDIKEFASWGTGFLFLDKGYAEEAGASSALSYQWGNSVGDSWTQYYLEITGSDEYCVYFTEWGCT